jgi:hypothetical protein
MIRSFRSSQNLSFLAVSVAVIGLGCNSQTGSEYQNFSDITEVNGSSTASDNENLVAGSAVFTPLRAPRPEMSLVDETISNGTNDEGELIALKAPKPFRGQTTGDLKDAIENLAAPDLVPREIKLLVKAPSFRKENDAFRISYDDLDLLKVLNMQPVPEDAVSYFPDWLSALDGTRITIRGFMMPPFRDTDIRGFVLARDNDICCMGKNPKIYDLIEVQMRKDVTTNYILNRPFDVVGTFHIRPEVEDGEWLYLYEITDAVVIDK